MQWTEVPGAPAPPTRRISKTLGSIAPIVVIGLSAVVLALRGAWWRTLLAGALLAVLLQVRSVAPGVEQRFTDAIGALGRALGAAVGWACLAGVFIAMSVVSTPGRLLHRHPVPGTWGTLGPAGASDSAWRSAEPTRPHAARVGSRFVRFAGVLAVVAAADCLVGAVLTGSGVLPPDDRGDVRISVLESTPMASPLVAGQPWAKQYSTDLSRYVLDVDGSVPYIGTVPHRFRSPNINVIGGERVSYEPPVPAGRRPLQLAFFGGSVMFGTGQRDAHTVPSEFARIAAANGVPVQVHNYGLPAWVIWQEQLYLERLLAHGHHYDLVIFLDGFNEFATQSESYTRDPSLHAAAWTSALANDFRAKRQVQPGYLGGLGELLEDYHRNSATWRIVDALTGDRKPLQGAVPSVHGTPAQQADAALEIYQRGVDMVDEQTGHHHTPVHYFWQPQAAGWDPAVLGRLPAETTSLASVFDGRQKELYIDPVHTTEEGARILAEALWQQVGGELHADAR
jgi:hypothetical protein